MSKFLLKNVRPLVDGALVVSPTDMLFQDGVWTEGESTGATSIEGHGALVLPSLFALGVDFQEPARDEIYNVEDGLEALIRGGFSGALYESAANPIDDLPKLKSMQQMGAHECLNIRFLGAFSVGFENTNISSMLELTQGGVAGFGDGGYSVGSLRFLRLAMEYAHMSGQRLFLHPMEMALKHKGIVHEGVYSDTLGMKGIPRQAESIAVYEILELALWLKVPVHLRQITCAESLDLIQNARSRGADVTCDVGVYHLLFDDSSLFELHSNLNIQPPLRTPADQNALWTGLLNQTIQAISCNHLPVLPQDKDVNFEDAMPGAISLEVALSALWQPALTRLQGNPSRLLEWLGAGPAAIAGAPWQSLTQGQKTDFVLFDPDQSWTVQNQTFVGKPHNSPLLGKTLTGRILGSYLGAQWYPQI